jgi:nitrite reductase (NO-forming)
MVQTDAAVDRRASSTIAVFVAIGAFVIATLAVVVASTDAGDSSSAGTAPNPPLAVSMTEFAFTPSDLRANPGAITLVVTNDGAQIHNLQVTPLGATTPDLGPGESATLDLGNVGPGVYAVICHIPGHADAGMKTTLTVASGGAAPAAAATASVAPEDQSDDAVVDFAAEPDDGFVARSPDAPPPSEATLHEITLEASEVVLPVAPGVSQEMWTFNLAGEQATVPGPILRGHIGDTFRVTLVNKGKLDHSIDFHASKVAWNDEMRSIHPGESLVYEFTATAAGAYLYHCGTAPALHHIGNGMYGAIIIDPPDLPPVAHEYVLVQSELYTGPEGQAGNLAEMVDDDWDAVMFNGYVNQYKFRPIRVEPDERVRVWVIDDGPSENSAFHIVGTIFDTVWKEGSYLLRPDASQGGSQVLDLQPAQGGFVELTFAEAGLYPIVTHKFSNVGKGALGLFQAGEPLPGAPAAGH